MKLTNRTLEMGKHCTLPCPQPQKYWARVGMYGQIAHRCQGIFPFENIMNSDTDIIIIKSALLECDLVPGNFYPGTVFVLTGDVRWTSVPPSEKGSWK